MSPGPPHAIIRHWDPHVTLGPPILWGPLGDTLTPMCHQDPPQCHHTPLGPSCDIGTPLVTLARTPMCHWDPHMTLGPPCAIRTPHVPAGPPDDIGMDPHMSPDPHMTLGPPCATLTPPCHRDALVSQGHPGLIGTPPPCHHTPSGPSCDIRTPLVTPGWTPMCPFDPHVSPGHPHAIIHHWDPPGATRTHLVTLGWTPTCHQTPI